MKIQTQSVLSFVSIFIISTITVFSISHLAVIAGNTYQQQVFPLSRELASSSTLGVSGYSAYITSSVGNNRGLLLSAVVPGSLAARIGMSPGDVLLNLNSHVVENASTADRILSETPSGILKSTFVRPGAGGLQLYNQSTNYTNVGGARQSVSSQNRIPRPSQQSHSEQKKSLDAVLPQVESYVIELVNADRQKFGLPALQVNSQIGQVARTYAQDMATRGFKAHIDPEGRDPTARGLAGGLHVQLGENLGWAFGGTPQELAKRIDDQMMGEPPNNPNNHRGNILNPLYVAIGCGAAFNQKTAELNVVEDFCTSNP
jgi:uncharacterized protein YkwD